MFALPIFPGSRPPSIVGVHALNFLFAMAASPSAAGGGCSEGAAWAAVDKIEHLSRCDDFIGHRNRKQVDPHDNQPQQSIWYIIFYTLTILDRKKPRLSVEAVVFALLIFPGSHPPSIVSVHVLNFCVRDGNRWTHMTINTNYMDGFNHRLCQMPKHLTAFGL